MNQRRMRGEWFALTALGSVLVLILGLPLVALVVETTPSVLWEGLAKPQVWAALRLSLVTTVCSLVLVVTCGTPLAWVLSQTNGKATRWLETVIALPMVIPPAVSGLALLLAFGRRGVVTNLFGISGSLAFTTGAVIAAQTFVSAPFYVQAATTAFRRLDPDLLLVARTLGAGPWRLFWSVALPLAGGGLFAGAAMSWARALGEFGATLMFAGNLQGVTQTLPLAIYIEAESDMRSAQALSLVLMIVAFGVLYVMRRSMPAAAASVRAAAASGTAGGNRG